MEEGVSGSKARVREDGGIVVKGVVSKEVEVMSVVDVEKKSGMGDRVHQVFVPKYSSSADDVSWATKGVVVSVLNGEAISVLQRRIYDAGFDNLLIIPLGADKVLLKVSDEGDVLGMLSEASQFFDNFFSNPIRWNKDILVCERGAWVRIYGVPLHAWNINFFKLCVMDCGRMLRVDDVTVDKGCLDYARILVSTTSLELLNLNISLVVDDAICRFKVIEEGGFSLAEDACLFDDEASLDEVTSGTDALHDNVGDSGDVHELLNTLSDEWNQEVQHQKVASNHIEENEAELNLFKNHKDNSGTEPTLISTSAVQKQKGLQNFEAGTSLLDHVGPIIYTNANSTNIFVNNEPTDAHGGLGNAQKFLNEVNKKGVKRTTSCPPGRGRSLKTGPWSLEWVNRNKGADAGGAATISYAPISSSVRVPIASKKKKGGGYLRNGAKSLKRIGRMSDKDRREILRALQRNAKKRRRVSTGSKVNVTPSDGVSSGASQSFVNNDWENWLVLHGNKKITPEDVCGIGKTVGIEFKGDKNNMFDVLSGVGRKKSESVGGGK